MNRSPDLTRTPRPAVTARGAGGTVLVATVTALASLGTISFVLRKHRHGIGPGPE